MNMKNCLSSLLGRAALVLWLCCGTAMAAQGLPWFDGDRPGAQAHEAVAVLAAAASHGLASQDYSAAALGRAITGAAPGSSLDAAAMARREQALTTAMERYLADVHSGRVDPQ